MLSVHQNRVNNALRWSEGRGAPIQDGIRDASDWLLGGASAPWSRPTALPRIHPEDLTVVTELRKYQRRSGADRARRRIGASGGRRRRPRAGTAGGGDTVARAGGR